MKWCLNNLGFVLFLFGSVLLLSMMFLTILSLFEFFIILF